LSSDFVIFFTSVPDVDIGFRIRITSRPGTIGSRRAHCGQLDIMGQLYKDRAAEIIGFHRP
jgi:hypothetical protein